MNDKQPENKLGGMPFGEAVERLAKTNPNEMPSKDIVPHKHNGQIVHQRATDGYINATAMCKASNKEWSNYNQNSGTQSFLDALERSLGIPRDLLIQTITGGPNDRRGTWVHPQVAINLATWISPDFAVQVSEWVVTWMMGIAKRKSHLNASIAGCTNSIIELPILFECIYFHSFFALKDWSFHFFQEILLMLFSVNLHNFLHHNCVYEIFRRNIRF